MLSRIVKLILYHFTIRKYMYLEIEKFKKVCKYINEPYILHKIHE